MRYLKTYEGFIYDENSYNRDLKKHGKEFADMMLKSSKRGEQVSEVSSLDFDSPREDIEAFVEYYGLDPYTRLDSDNETKASDRIEMILNYINNDSFILYRVLRVKDETDIDKEDLGQHFTMNKDVLNDSFFLEQIDSTEGEHSGEYYVVTVKATKDDVLLETTLEQSLKWTHEYEVTLKKDNNVEILNIEPLND
jgi:hypothetical protein